MTLRFKYASSSEEAAIVWIRLYKGMPAMEVEVKLREVPVDDNLGKEVMLSI